MGVNGDCLHLDTTDQGLQPQETKGIGIATYLLLQQDTLEGSSELEKEINSGGVTIRGRYPRLTEG